MAKARSVRHLSAMDAAYLAGLIDGEGTIALTRKRASKRNHAPGLCYAITNRQALSLLQQTYPFLHSYKRGRAELVLENYLALTPRNGKYSHDLLLAREAFVGRFSEIRPPRHGGDVPNDHEVEELA